MADKPTLETRTITTQIELRDAESTAPTVEGYAATFSQPYDLGAFREQVDPEAFVRTGIPRMDQRADPASLPDVRLLVDHAGQPLARTKSGTLDLHYDSTGLHMRSVLDASDPDVQRLLPKMRRGDLDQMSFAFRVPRGGDSWDDGLRTLREINMQGGDVSVVTYPANPETSVNLRSRDVRDAHFVYVQHIVDEMRAGATVSDVDMTRLRQVLDLIAATRGDLLAPRPVVADVPAAPTPDAPSGDPDAARSAGPSLQYALARVASHNLRHRRTA